MMPLWITEMSSAFWTNAGWEEPFPRNLRRAIASALPLAIVLLPALRVEVVAAWLRDRDCPCDIPVGNRALRACLVARNGHGIVFLDGADPENEQRFSLAHELAHFILHYLKPRRVIWQRLGRDALEVLDGQRPPRQDERIHALLASVSLGFYTHMLDRPSDGNGTLRAVNTAERDADHLAFELLAPHEKVLQEVRPCAHQKRQRVIELLLEKDYGLPAVPANRYSSLLAPSPGFADSFVRRLGLGH